VVQGGKIFTRPLAKTPFAHLNRTQAKKGPVAIATGPFLLPFKRP